jgi:hypothetical protein
MSWKKWIRCKYMMRKKGVLQLTLQLIFWIAMTIWNSPYVQCNSLQLNCNYAETIHFQLLRNSTTTIAISHVDINNFHPSIKTWHMALWRFLDFFFEILISIVYYDYWWFNIMTSDLIKIYHMAFICTYLEHAPFSGNQHNTNPLPHIRFTINFIYFMYLHVI